MLLISQQEIKQIISMKDAIAMCKEALKLASSGNAQIPLRINMPIEDKGQFLFKPGYIPSLDTAGVKIVSVFPENTRHGKEAIQAQMLLMNARNGDIQAIIEGTYLTELRTGAIQGAATDVLARADAKTAVLIGTGGQALAQLEALLNVRDLSQIWVCGRNYEKTQKFVTQAQFPQFKTQIIAVENCNDVIADADIITAVTNSKTPVFDGKLVKKGAHINGMGAYTPQMQELPEEIILAADKIFFDTKEGVLAEAGDFTIPLSKHTINQSQIFNELGDLLLGKAAGRETKEQITLFKSVGTAVLDIVIAFHIYQQALAQKIGTNFNF